MIFINRGHQSIRSALFEQVFVRAKISHGPDAPPPRFLMRQYTKSLLSSTPPRLVRARLDVQSFEIEGQSVHILIPRTDKCMRLLVYFHGGSYVTTFTRQHWNFLSKLAEATKTTIIAPDYPLAPQRRWSDAYRMLFALWEKIAVNFPPGYIGLMGDSAGGGLALGFAQALRDVHRPLPATVIMLSPWLDVTLENPEISHLSPIDPFLNVEALRVAGKAWAGGSNPRRHEISPLFGRMDNLPPLSLFIGTKDILLADCRKLWNICAASGVHLDYYEYEQMMHVWMLMPIRESGYAMGQIAGILATQTPCADRGQLRAIFEEVGA